jgi:hypothetical protein
MPDSTTLLSTWEAGQMSGETERAVLLHSLVHPQADRDQLSAVPIGARDAELAALRRDLFGANAGFRLECPHCGEQLEFELDPVEVLAAAGGESVAGPPITGPGLPVRREVTVESWTVRYRTPTAGDVAAAVAAGPARARAVLLDSCLLGASRDGVPVPLSRLPAEVVAEVVAAAAAADPQADPQVAVPCPACPERVPVVFDVAATLWSELDRWARGALLDVHRLALAYGWNEPEVLALSPARRRYYLDLVADD